MFFFVFLGSVTEACLPNSVPKIEIPGCDKMIYSVYYFDQCMEPFSFLWNTSKIISSPDNGKIATLPLLQMPRQWLCIWDYALDIGLVILPLSVWEIRLKDIIVHEMFE